MRPFLCLGLAWLVALPSLAADINPAHLEGQPNQRTRLSDLQGSNNLSELTLKQWMNSEPLTWQDLEGKVVVLDFWATWCGPCIRSIPHNNKMAKKFGDKMVFIGVCHPRGGEKMAAMAKEKGIAYPIAIDEDGKLAAHFKVNGFPDYYVIADGKVWGADVANSAIESALDDLLGS